jgi:hypothetical protein
MQDILPEKKRMLTVLETTDPYIDMRLIDFLHTDPAKINSMRPSPASAAEGEFWASRDVKRELAARRVVTACTGCACLRVHAPGYAVCGTASIRVDYTKTRPGWCRRYPASEPTPQDEPISLRDLAGGNLGQEEE